MKGRASLSEAGRPRKRIVSFPFLLWDITLIYLGKRIQRKDIGKIPGLFLECDMWPFCSLKHSSLRCRFKVTHWAFKYNYPLETLPIHWKTFQNPETQRDTLSASPSADGFSTWETLRSQGAQDPGPCRGGLWESPSGTWVNILALFPVAVIKSTEVNGL